jgi:hypothetical protein
MFNKFRLVAVTVLVVCSLSYMGNAETIDTGAFLMALAALIRE